jgi:ribonuclease inhibitor
MEVKMMAELDGLKIQSETDFHVEIALALGFGPYYGKNLDALWDVLSRDVERPVFLVWTNADVSQKSMPFEFRKIIDLLREVEKQDADCGAADRFELTVQ